MSEDDGALVELTTDFEALLVMYRLSDGASCGNLTEVARGIDVDDDDDDDGNEEGEITYDFVVDDLTAGDYTIRVTSLFFDEPGIIFCTTPGNYTLYIL